MKINNRKKRHLKIRKKIVGTTNKPRLSVFRSNKNTYAQIIDDSNSKTLVSTSSTTFKSTKNDETKSQKIIMATLTGEKLASLALKQKITKIIFDRGGYKFHGRIKALAEGAKKGGLKF